MASRPFSMLLVFLCSAALHVHAEDWTTTDGTVYHNVKVLSHDTCFVTILDSDGGARVPLRLLPTAIQAKYGYDAKAAADLEKATEAKDKADARAVETAQEQAQAAALTNAPAVASTQPTQAAAPPVTDAPASAAASGADDQIKAAQRQDIKDKIASLQGDISQMQKETAVTTRTSSGGDRTSDRTGNIHTSSHGGYDDKIADDRRQIQELQDELAKL